MGKNWGEKFRTLASICAVGGCAIAIFGWVFNLLPFALARDLRAVDARVAVVEGGLKASQLKQAETLELQLMQQIDSISAKLENMSRTGGDYFDLRAERTAREQRLGSVRSELSSLRAGQ